jgi:23S rRNA (uridine2552-2'-O)-methyltransferase
MSKPFVRKDRFYFKAKKEGYPARSAYKIIELDRRCQIFKPGRKIVDLGCAPGGWLKVAQEKLGPRGRLVGIDLLPLKFTLSPQTHFIQGDFTTPANQEKIIELLGGQADWVLSDMSPNLSGITFRDTFQSTELVRQALGFTLKILKTDGGFLFKIFPGPELEVLRKDLARHFKKIRTVIPEATRQSSTEIYIVCSQPRG